MVWRIEQWMPRERETACDELVVARGAQPEAYLSGVVKVCRLAFGGAEGHAGSNEVGSKHAPPGATICICASLNRARFP